MKKICEYCGQAVDSSEERCPSCGATNPNYKYKKVSAAPAEPVETTAQEEPAQTQPKTIEELKQWYIDRNLPPEETTRFFIGKNYLQPRAFGIYEDNGIFIVYKNKNDGSRAIRYQGTDEAYAVNELLLKLKSEILNQKARNGSDSGSSSVIGSLNEKGNVISGGIFAVLAGIMSLFSAKPMIMIALVLVPVAAFALYRLFFHRKPLSGKVLTILLIAYIALVIIGLNVIGFKDDVTYYRYDGTVYAEKDDSYYCYDRDLDDYYYVPYYLMPDEIIDYPDDYLYDIDENPRGVEDFHNSDYYSEHYSSDSDSDSDYDWDSGSDWDSGGSDFDSDW